MTTHVGYPVRGSGLTFEEVIASRRVGAGVAVGMIGGTLLALPLVLWDWASSTHSALELPMAAGAWLFGLENFTQNGYQWWPIVLGILFLGALTTIAGEAFAGLADRVFELRTWAASLGGGFAWGIAAFVCFWYVLLPVARDGAPFRATAASSAYVAPNWVWILGFVLAGLTSGAVYQLVRERATS